MYQDLLGRKRVVSLASGFDVPPDLINPTLFDFQQLVTRWAVARAKAALFEECGLGKTLQELEWGTHVNRHTGGKIMLLSPLGVSHQIVREADKFGYSAKYARSQREATDCKESIIVTNFDMLHHFTPDNFAGVIVDESSILKAFMGKMKRLIMTWCKDLEYKLAASATPAPNDHLELGNHAQFLDVMDSNEMISRFFINDTMEAGHYRLIKHAEEKFWDWVATWAVCISRPSDLGCSDDGWILPVPDYHTHVIEVDHTRAQEEHGQLFFTGQLSATELWKDKGITAYDRCVKAAEIVNATTDFCIVWCESNDESRMLAGLIPDAIEVKGNQSIKVKEERLRQFSEQEARVIITKPGIAGFGLNWQHATTQVFVSMTFSFEKLYQAMRRTLRYGLKVTPQMHFIYAESEGNIMDTLKQKQEQYAIMQGSMRGAMRRQGLTIGVPTTLSTVEEDLAEGDGWQMLLGDCVTTVARLSNKSIDNATYSPPFANLYIYSDSEADMGNSVDQEEFMEHYGYLLAELARVTKDDGTCVVHCKDLPLYLNRDGAMGLDDFPGALIRAHEAAGFTLERWITVWKDPVIEMQRTKNAGLLWSSAFCERATRARQGMADFGLVFRKGKRQMEYKHRGAIDPDVVARCVDLWANPGEVVWTPGYPMPTAPLALVIEEWELSSINASYEALMDGRLYLVRCHDPRQMQEAIEQMATRRMVFHTRIHLTDGTWLVGFRKWVETMPENNHVTHRLKADTHTFVGRDAPRWWHDDRDYSIQVWQRYASPVWYDLGAMPSTHPDCWMKVNQTNVLNFTQAREDRDEKHICPLQLDFIELVLEDYTAPGDTVLSPFSGIGSEGVIAVKRHRHFIGVELKRSYWEWACRHLAAAEIEANTIDLFTAMGVAV